VFSVVVAAALSYSGASWSATEQVGVASAVNPAATGTPPGLQTRVVRVGLKMIHEERVVTDDGGRMQLLFLDGSALTIGPNSEVVLDEFVYDPEAKTGKLAFSATKGLFRLVGGKISKTTPVTFKTPTAVIGIRGGIGLISVREVKRQANAGGGLSAGDDAAKVADDAPLRLAQAPGGAPVVTTAQLAFGVMTVTSGGVQRVIDIPGFEVEATSPDAPPGQPTRAADAGDSLAGLEGSGDDTGGASDAPTNEDVADTQIADLGSSNAPAAVAPPAAPGTGLSAAVGDTAVLQDQTDDTTSAVETAQQNTALDETTGTTGGERSTGISNDLVYSGRYLSQTPFSSFDFDTGLTTRVTSRNTDYSNGSVSNGFFTATLVDGSTLRLPAKTTDNFDVNDSETESPFGAVSGTGFGSPDGSFFYWNLQETTQGSNPASVFAGVAFTGSFPTSGVTAHDVFPGFPGDNTIPMLPKDYGGDFQGAPTPMMYSAWSANSTTFPDDARSVGLYALVAIDGTGSNQKSASVMYTGVYYGAAFTNNKIILSGTTRGSVRSSATGTPLRVDGASGVTSRDGDGNSFFGLNDPDHFVLSSDFDDGKFNDAAAFVQSLENTATPVTTFFMETYTRPAPVGSVGTTRTSQTLYGYTAGMVANKVSGVVGHHLVKTDNGSNGGYDIPDPTNFTITTAATTNRASASASLEDNAGVRPDLVIPFGSLTGASASRSAFIDDERFGLRRSNKSDPTFDGVAGTSRIALFTSAFMMPSSALTSGITFCTCTYTKWGIISGEVRKSDYSERHRFHLMPWAAGKLADAATVAAKTGTATFDGHVMANILNGSNNYVAFGNYSQTWNFATDKGRAIISNLDGATYDTGADGLGLPSGNANQREFTGTLSGPSSRSGTIDGSFMQSTSDSTGEVAVQFYATGSSYYVIGAGAGAKQ
jgi:hypothetical protein